ncbi:hypothetical protein BLS_000642 [Venturia inaequalis]|uniref:Uncharacterized protein n=1 Tax=Venturia inaequalis TaxID=5025 RepID=A0A8H3UY02_VENIN|nr:hypothetical protein BLS_000642 [Venturia inaequalis]
MQQTTSNFRFLSLECARHREQPAAVSATFQPVMDINRWLAETAVAVGPAKGSHQPGNPGGREHGKTAPVVDLESSKCRKRRAKRHQVISEDSSIIAPEDVPTEAPVRRIPQHVHQDSVGKPPSERADHSSHLEDEDETDANPYQRKKRRKTKADRYDLKPQEQETHEHGGKQQQKPARKSKKAKPSKKDKSAPEVVRNFRAANVPRERLTLLPRANVGIFKKGKASSPFRGRGLPDLAFSEMNFLSKRRSAAEEVADTEETHKRRKKDRKRANEEEISSYFAPKRPPMAERSLNEPAIQNTTVRDEIQYIDDIQRQSSTVPAIRPTTETLAAPELDDRRSCQQSTSNTYFTWSDSLRHSSGPAIVRPASTTDLEAYGAKPVSTALTRKKVRASSFDLRPPDLVGKRQAIRRPTARDHKRSLASSHTNLLLGDVTISSSLPRLNQFKGPTLERATSVSLPRTAQGSTRSIDSQSLPAAIISPTKAAQQKQPIVSSGTKILQADKSTPVLESQDPNSISIANLLNDCDVAYLTNTKNLGGNDTEVEEEDLLFNGQNDRFFSHHVPQMEDPRTLEEKYYTFESEEEQEMLHHIRPDMIGYGEQIQRPQPTVATGWPSYETHYHPIIQQDSMGEILMTDLEGDEEEPSEQLDLAEEVQEEDGFAGFWKPNMLY